MLPSAHFPNNHPVPVFILVFPIVVHSPLGGMQVLLFGLEGCPSLQVRSYRRHT